MKYLQIIMISLFFVTPAFAGEMCEISNPHNCVNANNEKSASLYHKPITALRYANQETSFLTGGEQNIEKASVNYSVNIKANSHRLNLLNLSH